jgi:hypothetical protein
LLGVRNSSVFLVNATIWVEGITDRLYLREYLRLYVSHLTQSDELILDIEEDVHYCFVEYGGSNITHWSFLDKEKRPIQVDRLCGRAMLVIDKDGERKIQRIDELHANLGDRLCVLPCREVENLLPYEVIKKIVLDYENTPELILPDIEYQEYKDEYLGSFIENNMLKNSANRKGSYSEKSGTITAKPAFCDKAISYLKVNTFTDLPSTTQDVVKKLYEFICARNI